MRAGAGVLDSSPAAAVRSVPARLAGAAAALGRLLARAPWPGRLLALGGGLSLLALAWAALGLPGGSAGDARIGLLLGGGTALLVLPRALGWPVWALRAVVAVVAAVGWGLRLALGAFLPQETIWALMADEILLLMLGTLALVMIPGFLGRRGSLVKALASGLLGFLLVSLGVEATILGGEAWLALVARQGDGAFGGFALALYLACALWGMALLSARLEGRCAHRWAGRMVALRGALMAVGGGASGLALALQVAPAAGGALWGAAFGTPLEGAAPLAGWLAGMLAGLAAAGAALALPGVLARRQLAGELEAGAAAEAGWVAALALSAGFAPLVSGSLAAVSVAVLLAVAAHTVLRLALGRVAPRPGTPLWLFLPAAPASAASLALAAGLARAWERGPVTLVAPAATAPAVMGPHLRLARQAGVLPLLRVATPVQQADWRRAQVPAELWRALPRRELYGTAGAWRAALAAAGPVARMMMVLDGPAAPGWAPLPAEVPPDCLRVARTAAALPPGADEAGWIVRDFSRPEQRKLWLPVDRLWEDAAPRAARRILLLHGAADAPLARDLAAALDGRVDLAGRPVGASTLARHTSAAAAWAYFLGPTWETVLALGARYASARARDASASLFVRLAGLVADVVYVRGEGLIDVLLLEGGDAPPAGPEDTGRPELEADRIIALLPAQEPSPPPSLSPTAYTGILRLPPPSALDAGGIEGVARRILDYEFAPPGMVGWPVREEAAPSVPVFLTYVQEYARYRHLLEDALLARGLDVRSDRLLAPGDEWDTALPRMLAECRVQVVVAGPALVRSTFALREIEAAAAGGLRIVPVVVALFSEPQTLLTRQFANAEPLETLDEAALAASIARIAEAIAQVARTFATPTS